MRYDPRWADPEFRAHCREMDHRLREEARSFQQIGQATWQLAAYVWEMSGEHQRAAVVRHGGGDPANEYAEAVVALDEQQRLQLRAALETVAGYLEGKRGGRDGR